MAVTHKQNKKQD